MNRTDFLYAHPMQFQRGERKVRVKKQGRKASLKMKHILISIAGLALLFFLFYKLYFFLITWDKLNIRDIQVACLNEKVKDHVLGMTRSMTWGNIFLLDISKVQKRLGSYAWVKDVQVRKTFPASLKIDIAARTPAALMEKETIYLIDDEGVALEQSDLSAYPGLPLLLDEGHFSQDSQEKLRLTRECLKGLSSEDKNRVETLDFSDMGDVILQFRGSPTKIKLGADRFAQNLDYYQNNIVRWESELGGLEYVDLRFPDRVIVKPLKNQPEAASAPHPAKEAP
jgi:cell division septal protein FtsQ